MCIDNIIEMSETAEQKALREAKGKMDANTGGSDVLEFIKDEEKLQENLLKRFQKLKELKVKSLSSSVVVNGGWEDGRVRLPVSDKMKVDPSNVFSSPTLDDLQKLGWRAESNACATAEELGKISAQLEALGVPKEKMAAAFWDIARYCTSVGSSPFVNPKGTIDFPNGSITRDAAFAVIKKFSSLRQVCRSFAPITWNYMHITNQPPEDWAKKGFKYDDRFAAFDTFDFVESPAAIQPAEGLVVRPTPENYVAFFTHKRLALANSDRSKRFANNSSDVSGGMFGCDNKVNFPNRPC